MSMNGEVWLILCKRFRRRVCWPSRVSLADCPYRELVTDDDPRPGCFFIDVDSDDYRRRDESTHVCTHEQHPAVAKVEDAVLEDL